MERIIKSRVPTTVLPVVIVIVVVVIVIVMIVILGHGRIEKSGVSHITYVDLLEPEK